MPASSPSGVVSWGGARRARKPLSGAVVRKFALANFSVPREPQALGRHVQAVSLDGQAGVGAPGALPKPHASEGVAQALEPVVPGNGRKVGGDWQEDLGRRRPCRCPAGPPRRAERVWWPGAPRPELAGPVPRPPGERAASGLAGTGERVARSAGRWLPGPARPCWSIGGIAARPPPAGPPSPGNQRAGPHAPPRPRGTTPAMTGDPGCPGGQGPDLACLPPRWVRRPAPWPGLRLQCPPTPTLPAGSKPGGALPCSLPSSASGVLGWAAGGGSAEGGGRTVPAFGLPFTVPWYRIAQLRESRPAA